MGIFDSYMKSFSTNMLGRDKRSEQQQEEEGGRFFEALGAAAANRQGGRRPQEEATGPSFNDAFAKMQQQMTSTPSGQDSPAGPMPEASPLERMMIQSKMLMGSGVPEMEKLGSKMLEDYYQESTKAPTKTTNLKDYEAGIENPEYAQYLKDKQSKSGININMGEGGREGTKLSEADLQEWGLSPGTNYVHTKTGPKPVAQAASDEGTGAANTLELATGNMEDMLFGDEGIYSGDFGTETGLSGLVGRTVKGNIEKWTKDDPRFADYSNLAGGMIANIARGLGGEKGPLSDSDMARVEGLLPQVSGKDVDTKVTARKKMDILKQLQEVKKMKGGVTADDIQRIMGKSDGEPKVKTGSGTPELPEGFTWD